MTILLCFLLPSLVSIEIEKILLKVKIEKIDLILKYGLYCLFNNIMTIIIIHFLINIDTNIEESIRLYPGVAVKYALTAILIAIILGLIKIILIKNIEVNLERENKEDN